MQKIINSNTAKYQPMLTDNLVLDDKPTVNSFNSVTSDGVARAIADAQGGGGAEYSAGTGISISAQDEISVDTTVIATKNDLSSYQPTISDLETIRSGAAAGATAVQPGSLATVATSGSYNDLSNKPTIPAAQIQSDWNQTDTTAVDFIKNKPNIPSGVVVDQTYSASSTNAQSGTAVAGALATVNQVPASTSADEDKVLTVNSSGTPVWAAAQGGGGGGSSYTFSAPLSESAGTVVLDVDTDELNIGPKQVTLSAQREISAAESGYAWFLGNLAGDTSDTVYTFTVSGVPVPNSVQVAYFSQGKHIYPMLVGETYGSWGNQWIIPTALSVNGGTGELTGSFSVCFKSGESDYPTHLDSYGQLSWASVLVFVVADNVPSAQVSSSNIYGSTTSGSTVSYSTGGSMLLVKHPVPAVNLADNGKVLKATYSNGVGSFGWDTAPSELPSVTGNAGKVLSVNSGATGVQWTNFTQIEVVASMPANPTSGVLYIVTGA